MARNNAARRHFTRTPFRFHTAHFGPNREQRRAAGHRDPVTKRLIVEPSINFSYRKDHHAPQAVDHAATA